MDCIVTTQWNRGLAVICYRSGKEIKHHRRETGTPT